MAHDLIIRGGLIVDGTGREPFTGTTATALALKHLGEPPPKLTSLRDGTPPVWDDLLDKLLAKQPEQRFSSAAEVAEAIQALPVRESQ